MITMILGFSMIPLVTALVESFQHYLGIITQNASVVADLSLICLPKFQAVEFGETTPARRWVLCPELEECCHD
jgi:hypothetical protein